MLFGKAHSIWPIRLPLENRLKIVVAKFDANDVVVQRCASANSAEHSKEMAVVVIIVIVTDQQLDPFVRWRLFTVLVATNRRRQVPLVWPSACLVSDVYVAGACELLG